MILKENIEETAKSGMIINLSNHKVNHNCFSSIQSKFALNTLEVYNADATFNFEEDLWRQVEGILRSLKKEKRKGKDCFCNTGVRFLLVPAATVGAVMLAMALTKIWGIAPYICLVGANKNGKIVLKQIIDLESFNKKAQSYWRGALIFNRPEPTMTPENKLSKVK